MAVSARHAFVEEVRRRGDFITRADAVEAKRRGIYRATVSLQDVQRLLMAYLAHQIAAETGRDGAEVKREVYDRHRAGGLL